MESINRRKFLGVAALAGTGMAMTPSMTLGGVTNFTPILSNDDKPALLGGAKAHPDRFPGWPVYDSTEEQAFLDVLKSYKWGRLDGRVSARFEQEFAKLNGVNHCLAVSSGSSALYTMLGALGIGPGDEVLLPVYTFVATYNMVALNYALPILIDTDPESFQIDAKKMEKAITKETKVLMPVHIGGSPADIDAIMAIAQKHKLPVIEDACQAHLAEWKGKKVGTFGLGGAFSFQSSKNLNCAEGGAIITNDGDFRNSCYGFHNQGQGGASTSYGTGGQGTRGTNLRITEFQANLLLAQMTRLEAQTKKRSQNADYLTKLFNEIQGITPAKLYEGTTVSAYHLYMFRYDKSKFDGLSRARFLQALEAEGVPCSSGYGQMNKSDYVTGLANNRHYLKIYGEKIMKQWLERNQCPQNDKLTSEESVWFTQGMLLGTTRDVEQIANAVRKIQKYASELTK
jgi:dTDP-4-amino-4,6-dideoxygalactose transaminase